MKIPKPSSTYEESEKIRLRNPEKHLATALPSHFERIARTHKPEL